MASGGGMTNIEPTVAQAKRLVNAQLKNVCKGAGLPVSGAKAALQNRIITQLERFVSQGNYEGLYQLKALIHNPNADAQIHTQPIPSTRAFHNNSMGMQYPYQNSFDPSLYRTGPAMTPTQNGVGTRGPHFKQSPFFTVLEPLTPVIECQELVREANRDTVHTTINLQPSTADKLNSEKTIRVLIYCTGEPGVSQYSRVDISFPHQVEIKVNQDEVKANLRGLKNKPGTTRPADITDLLRKRPNYSNSIAVTYALTKTRFYLVVNLVKQHLAEDLVKKLESGKIITRDRVIREMRSKADDSDIVATSTILSLKCPLSTLRIQVPCRSNICNHIQCFDATSFLQLQEQAPTWTCPICNKNVSFDNLHVDQYVDDILKSTSKSVEQVTIEPDGKWSSKAGTQVSATTQEPRASNEDDDELVEIQDLASTKSIIKPEFSQDHSMLRNPPISSREPSTSSGVPQPSNNKRPAAPIVDLTLSSDEDEEPLRAPKRQNTHRLSNGISASSNIDSVRLRPHAMSNMPHHPYPSGPYPAYGNAQFNRPT